MSPSEFWRLTYAELRLILEGCTQRRTREMKFQRHLAAWSAAIMVQPHVSEKITPGMLLGEKQKQKKQLSRESSIDAALDVAFAQYVRKDGE